MGIFLAPMIAGTEPRHQEKLAIALFVAVVLVVVGSLVGELLSYRGILPSGAAWWMERKDGSTSISGARSRSR